MSTPSIGRIVHFAVPKEQVSAYRPSNGEVAEGEVVVMPAIITAVGIKKVDGKDVDVVNLTVFADSDMNSHVKSVLFSEDYADGCWSWSPKV